MITIAAAVILAALVILERKNSIRMEYKSGSSLLMIGSALACGLYGFDFTRTVISGIAKLFGMDDAEFVKALAVKSGVGLVLKTVFLFLLLIPMAAGALYILIVIVSRPFGRGTPADGSYFAAKNGARTASLSATASAVMLAGGIISLLLTIPFWKELVATLVVLNPILLVFFTIFTGGLALPFIAVFAVVANIHLLSILTFGMIFVMMLYGYSAILGLASAVRSYKSGKAAGLEAFICGALALLPVWSIVPMKYLERKMKV